MVESVKAASDVYAPIAGKVIEVNQAIVDDPALVNREPAGEGWFFQHRAGRTRRAFDALMDDAGIPGAFVETL